MKCVVFEGDVPVSVVEGTVQPDQSRVLSLVTPGVFSILQLDLLELATIKRISELPHEVEVEVEVAIVLVRGLVDEIEISRKKPFGLIVSRCFGDGLSEEITLLSVCRGAVDSGDFEGGTACFKHDSCREKVSANIDVGDADVIFIP
jgi:hypothetical protein